MKSLANITDRSREFESRELSSDELKQIIGGGDDQDGMITK